MKYNDPSGHKLTQTQSWAIMGYLAGPMVGIGSMEGAVLGIGLKSYEKQISKMLRRSDPGRFSISRSDFGNGSAGKFTETYLGWKKIRSYFNHLGNFLFSDYKSTHEATQIDEKRNLLLFAFYTGECKGVECMALYIMLFAEYDKGDAKSWNINPFYNSDISIRPPSTADDEYQCMADVAPYLIWNYYQPQTTTNGVYGHSSSTSSVDSKNSDNTTMQAYWYSEQKCQKP
ncbi:MAG TPA: hypothetical protein PL163_16125 [Leptospiraceae bacterium]|nr:hypothetical protein [Leptospiraceae bacterium]